MTTRNSADTAEKGRRAAKGAGLTYVSDTTPGIGRRKARDGFGYVNARGAPVRDRAVLKRIRGIVIPPAWTDVWISPSPAGHIQATGRDARGRKQYRYHADFRSVRDSAKYDHLLDFARVAAKIRRRVLRDMRAHTLSREKVIATVIWLLDTTAMRVGNEDYARQNQSFGATTLRDRHVKINGGTVRFVFTGKSGKTWSLAVHDRRVGRIVKACQDLPGQHLFQYLDETGGRHAISSTDINSYLRDTTGLDITAKDFRTWNGTVMAAAALGAYRAPQSATEAKANVSEAIETVAAHLGNTPTICRKCYVHPAIIAAYVDSAAGKSKDGASRRAPAGLSKDEAAAFHILAAAKPRRPARARAG